MSSSSSSAEKEDERSALEAIFDFSPFLRRHAKSLYSKIFPFSSLSSLLDSIYGGFAYRVIVEEHAADYDSHAARVVYCASKLLCKKSA